MYVRAIKTGLITIVIALASAAAVTAQSSIQYSADIPFDFTARGDTFKAGKYTLGLLQTSGGFGPLVIRNRSGAALRVIGPGIGGPVSKDGTAKLVFVKNGDGYALAEIRTPDWGVRMKGTLTHVREMAKGSPANVVEIALAVQ